MDPERRRPTCCACSAARTASGPLDALSPEVIKARTFETLRQMCLRGSRRRPLVLEVEDLHWIDRTSEEYLTFLAESLAGAPDPAGRHAIGPGYRPPWSDRSFATQISLRRLAADESLSIVRSLLPAGRCRRPARAADPRQGRGQPVLPRGAGAGGRATRVSRRRLPVPDTVHGVLTARIDRLAEDAKRVLQTASVLGREFAPRLLAADLGRAGRDSSRTSRELARLEFLYERADRRGARLRLQARPDAGRRRGDAPPRRAGASSTAGRARRSSASTRIASPSWRPDSPITTGRPRRGARPRACAPGGRGRARRVREPGGARALRPGHRGRRSEAELPAADPAPAPRGRARTSTPSSGTSSEPAPTTRRRSALATGGRARSPRRGSSAPWPALWGGHKDYERGLALSREAVAAAERAGDSPARARVSAEARLRVGLMELNLAHMTASRRELTRALGLFREAGDVGGEGRALDALAMALMIVGDLDAVRRARPGGPPPPGRGGRPADRGLLPLEPRLGAPLPRPPRRGRTRHASSARGSLGRSAPGRRRRMSTPPRANCSSRTASGAAPSPRPRPALAIARELGHREWTAAALSVARARAPELRRHRRGARVPRGDARHRARARHHALDRRRAERAGPGPRRRWASWTRAPAASPTRSTPPPRRSSSRCGPASP